MPTKVYYFGCIGQAGHYMHGRDLHTDWAVARSNPWGYDIDGLYESGRLHHKDGWTAYGLPDYTVDKRPGSHSTFLAEGTFSEEEMIALACEHFPSITKRIGLAVRVDAKPSEVVDNTAATKD